jgi:diamine N-acetyltransferase
MFIKGQIVGLRATEPADAELLFQWENNINLWSVSNSQIPFSKFLIDEFVNATHQDIYTNKQLRLMISGLSNHATVGVIDLFEFDPQHNRCGVGIFVNESNRKQGIAQESIALVKEYVFNVLHLKQIFVHVNAGNLQSINLFEKSGFEKSGLKKFWQKVGLNTYEDVWFMQCINQLA